MFTQKQIEFGVLAVDNNGKSVKVYEGSNNFRYINVGHNVKEARWNGKSILVYLDNGSIRKYTDYGSFTNISK